MATNELSENTLVRLGLVVAILAMFATAVWWASGIQSDLNSIKITLSKFSSIESLNARVGVLEQYGSPKTLSLEMELSRLRKDFELHVATTTNLHP